MKVLESPTTAVITVIAFLCVGTLAVPGTVSAQEFRRGDADGDGVISVVDAAKIRDYMLLGGFITCLDAGDANDDGVVNILDVLHVFNFVFGVGDAVLSGECAEDTTVDSIDCSSYGACPEVFPMLEDPQHTLHIPAVASAPGESVVVPIYYDNLTLDRVAGFSFAVAHDEASVELLDVQFGEALLALQFDPPFFFQEVVAGGWVCGVIFQFYGTVDAPEPGLNLELYRATYELLSDTPTSIAFSSALGDPPVEIRLYQSDTGPKLPMVENGSIFPATFLRGDANADGNFDLADAIFQLSALFVDGPQPPCQDAADTNDDGLFDLGDVISSLNSMFIDAPQPSAPGPFVCGVDPTVDALGCAAFDPCF